MQLSGLRYQGGMARMRSRITFTRLSPGADRAAARRGVVGLASAGNARPRHHAIQKSAPVYTDARRNAFRCITSVCVPFYAHTC